MSFKLICQDDEFYDPIHELTLKEIHDFINAQNVLKLDKFMATGLIDLPDRDEGRITFKHKIELVS